MNSPAEFETAHPLPAQGHSQSARILAALSAHPGEWIAMPTLCHISGSYNVHSRISDLRAAGHTIDHKNERRDGLLLSFYRLVGTRSTASQTNPEPSDTSLNPQPDLL